MKEKKRKWMNVILYVLDSLRPDHLSCYGYYKETSPNIDQLAKEGIVFKHAFSQSTWTRASAASLLTGLYPKAVGVETKDDRFISKALRLPEMFKALGYKTIAISAMPNVSAYFGFARGFDVFIDLYKERLPKKRALLKKKHSIIVGKLQERKEILIPTSEDINKYLFPLLGRVKKEKFFIMLWSIDTHDPYFIRGDTDRFRAPRDQPILIHKDIVKMKTSKERERLVVLYDKMIYYNDYHLGNLINELVRLRLDENTLFIITADHGEAFGEHGRNSHAGPPYDEQIRVPLIIKFPNGEFSGQVVRTPVQLIDVLPTLQAVLPESLMIKTQGQNLLPLIRGESLGNRLVFSSAAFNPKLGSYFAVRTEQWKYILFQPPSLSLRTLKSRPRVLIKALHSVLLQPREWLFRIDQDKGETRNMVKRAKDERDMFKCLLLEWNKRNEIIKNSLGVVGQSAIGPLLTDW